MKVVSVEGPLVDQISFQPFMRLKVDLPLSLEDKTSSEDEKALIFYRSFMEAMQTYQQTVKSV